MMMVWYTPISSARVWAIILARVTLHLADNKPLDNLFDAVYSLPFLFVSI